MLSSSPAALPSARRFNLIAKKRTLSLVPNKRSLALFSRLSLQGISSQDQNNAMDSYLSDSADQQYSLDGLVGVCQSISMTNSHNGISTASEMEEEEENESYSSPSNDDFLESISMNESKELQNAPSKGKNLRILSQLGMRRFFEDAEEQHFRELEDRINDWLDAEGVNQVEPNAQRKLSNSQKVQVSANPLIASSLLARRKLKNLAVNLSS